MNPSLRTYLDKIIFADTAQSSAQLDIANMLTAIRDHKLYQQDGYDSFSMMVQCELDFSPATAARYCSLYNSFTRLRYSRDEFLKHMRTFGWGTLEKVLRGVTKKLGHRALKSRVAEERQASRTYTLTVTSKSDIETINHALQNFGFDAYNDAYRHGLTASVIRLIEDYQRLKGEEKRDARDTKAA